MNIGNQKFEEWRNEQINSLVRMGYPDAAKAFRDLGSIHWAGWQAAWKASRESVEIVMPSGNIYSPSEAASEADYHFDQGQADGLRKAKTAIEAAGLKVNP